MSRPLQRLRTFLEELRRRNVYRVAGAYVVVAAVAFQAAVLLVEPTRLPPYADDLLLAFLIVGFPVSVVVAWAFELTPEGLRRTRAADAGGPATAGMDGDTTAIESSGPAPGAEPASGLDSVAVLPFTDMSPEGDQEYFGDGIAEELINALTRMGGLKVAARTSAFSFKDRSEDVREIGTALGVGAILEGSVRTWQNRLRVTAQLVTADEGYHLWSETFERELEDVFRIQDEIVRSIVGALEMHLGPGEDEGVGARETDDLDTYILYLKGRHFWNQGTINIPTSLECFQGAVERNPDYAPAQAGLAAAYATMAFYGFTPPGEVRELGIQAAERALELDDGLPEVLTYTALARDWLQWDWEVAERGFRRALELNPRHVDAHHYLGNLLFRLGRADEARPHFRRALELDPLSPMAHFHAGNLEYFEQAFDRAVRHFEDALQLDPDFVLAEWLRVWAWVHAGRGEQAAERMERIVERTGRSNLFLTPLAAAYAAAGRSEEARGILAELKDRSREGHVDGYLSGLVCLVLGDTDQAIQWLEHSYAQRSPMLVYARSDPAFDAVADDPRYLDLLGRMDLDRA